jgi:hypothetical protein
LFDFRLPLVANKREFANYCWFHYFHKIDTQLNKQTKKQTEKQAEKETDRQRGWQTGRQAGKQTDRRKERRKTYRQTGRWKDKQRDLHKTLYTVKVLKIQFSPSTRFEPVTLAGYVTTLRQSYTFVT